MPTVRVSVTQQDIDIGKRVSGGACPLALALTRACGGDCWVYGFGIAEIGGQQFGMPEEATAFVLNFDCGHAVQPFEFDLEVPECASASP